MTTLLHALASLLARFPGITVVLHAEHVGTLQHIDVTEPDDEACSCGHDHDNSVGLVLPEPVFYNQLVDAGIRARNGDDPHDVAREAIAELRLAEAAHDALGDQ